MPSPRGVITPEAVVLELPTAGLASRLLARLVDVVVLMVLLQVLSLVFGVVILSAPALAQIVAILVVALVLLIYPVASESLLRGRTLGKMALGLRVVTAEGGPAGFRHAALRGLIGLVEIFGLLGSVAVVSALATSRTQRFGDLAAGTVVIRERDPLRRALAVAFPPPAGLEAYCAGLDVAAVGDDQYGVIRSFLLRVLELTPGARAALAVRLANPTAARMHHSPPPALGPELFLACVASAYQIRHGGLLVPHWSVPSAPAPGWRPPPPTPGAPGPAAPATLGGAAPAAGVAPGAPAWAGGPGGGAPSNPGRDWSARVERSTSGWPGPTW